MAGEAITVALGEVSHAGLLGQVLPEKAVGVLGGAALPGVMRGGEEESGAT